MYRAPRGTADILPQDQSYWRLVEAKADDICRLYGYGRIDTPVFEQADLFFRSVGEGTDIVEKQMYTFLDRGGDQMTLRPEGTAPVCRAYVEHGMHSLLQPVRLYYVTPIFRYERPQAGRFRQHRQFGAEAIGDGDPALDAEIISMAWHYYGSLGLDGLTLQLNSIGCPACRPGYLEALKEHYARHSQTLCADCKRRLAQNPLRLLDCKEAACQEVVRGAPRISDHLCPDCSRHFESLKAYLVQLDIPYELNPYLVRGLDYYTRTVFEIQPADIGGQSALGGGGRYDNLIEQLGGRPTPAIGFGTGLERVILNLRQQGIEPPSIAGPGIYIAYLGEQAKEEAVKLAGRLRLAGTGTTVALGNRSLKSQLKQANSLGFPQTVIMGEDEVKKGTAILRDMTTGEQVELPAAELFERLSGR